MSNEKETAPQLGRVVSVTAYTAEELKQINERAFQRAYNDYVVSIWETFGSDLVEEEMREYYLADRFPSLASAPLRWSLSYCQGDGVAFDSFTLTAEQVAELGEELKSGQYFRVVNSDGSHRWSFKVYGDADDEANQEEAEATAERLTAALRDICEELERIGYKYSEHLTSEARFIEDAENNGDLYDELGRVIL
jgi:hypothetical protein